VVNSFAVNIMVVAKLLKVLNLLYESVLLSILISMYKKLMLW